LRSSTKVGVGDCCHASAYTSLKSTFGVIHRLRVAFVPKCSALNFWSRKCDKSERLRCWRRCTDKARQPNRLCSQYTCRLAITNESKAQTYLRVAKGVIRGLCEFPMTIGGKHNSETNNCEQRVGMSTSLWSPYDTTHIKSQLCWKKEPLLTLFRHAYQVRIPSFPDAVFWLGNTKDWQTEAQTRGGTMSIRTWCTLSLQLKINQSTVYLFYWTKTWDCELRLTFCTVLAMALRTAHLSWLCVRGALKGKSVHCQIKNCTLLQ